MNPIELARIASRRSFLRNAGGGIGMMALADLLGRLRPRAAKRRIRWLRGSRTFRPRRRA